MKRREFISYSALLCGSSFNANGARVNDPWHHAAPLPLNIQELYPAVHKGKLYVAGGIASKLGVIYFTDRFLSFDPASNSWTDEAALPENLHHAALVSTGKRLFLVGGFNGSYSHIWRMRDRVYEYVDNRWVEANKLPQPRAEGVLSANGNDIHLVSGQSPKAKVNLGGANSKRSDHHEVATHLVWQNGAANWERAAPIPIACNSATGEWVGDTLIVTGGRTSKGNFNHTHLYDKREDKWRRGAPLPLPQAGSASVAVERGIIVFGGEVFTPKANVFSQVWRYDITTDEWTALADLVTPRHGLGAGKIGNDVYVIGGATQPSGKGTSNVNEVLSL